MSEKQQRFNESLESTQLIYPDVDLSKQKYFLELFFNKAWDLLSRRFKTQFLKNEFGSESSYEEKATGQVFELICIANSSKLDAETLVVYMHTESKEIFTIPYAQFKNDFLMWHKIRVVCKKCGHFLSGCHCQH